MPRTKFKVNNGSMEGVGHSFKPKPVSKKKKNGKRRSPFSLEPSLISSNLEKTCVRCQLAIPPLESYWWYPKLPGCVHKNCSKKKV